MELRGATVLILGGSGLVGTAIARRLFGFAPARIIITGLTRDEVGTCIEELDPLRGGCELVPEYGNIFLPAELSRHAPAAIDADPVLRRRVLDDLLGPLTESVFSASLLCSWLTKYRPDAVVDCVNTATALAYRDVFRSARLLLGAADSNSVTAEHVEKHLLTLELPQLIRHVQILSEGLRRAGSQAYCKIGTSGTGGMGLNIPYTHSEERPSRTLMTKSAVAGAHSMFMFLLGRTPGTPAIIEIKPTASIGWREIGFGHVRRAGRRIQLYDCEAALPLHSAFAENATGWSDTGRSLENVFINLGENGMFSRDEFEAVTALNQMELVTPEEIAELVALELTGRPTGKDVVAALDAATLGPSYRGGALRGVALRELEALENSNGVRSVAFEMLGPPRLTKLLYEAYLLGRLFDSVGDLAQADANDAANRSEALLMADDPELRRQIISVGIPVLLSDGNSVLRGAHVVVPPENGSDAAARGWVDLRSANMALWKERAGRIADTARPAGTASYARVNWIDPAAPISPPAMAVWIFENEDAGFRIKR